MADHISKIVAKYEVVGQPAIIGSLNAVDTAANAAKESFEKLNEAQQAADKANGDLGLSKVEQLNAAFDEQQQHLKELQAEQEAYNKDLDETLKTTQDITDQQEESGGGGSFASANGLRRAGGAASQLGLTEAGRGLSIAGDVAQLDKFKASLSSLNPEIIAVGGGIAGLTIVFDLYNKEQERTKALVSAEIDARQKALDLLRTGSQQEIQIRIDQLGAEKDTLEKNAADAKNILAQGQRDLAAQYGLQALGLEEVAASTGHATGAYQAAYDAAHKSADALDKNNTELDLLTANTGLAARSEAELAQARLNAAYITTDITNRVSAAQEAYNLELTGTSDQLAKRKNDLQNFITIDESAITEARNRLATEKLSIEEQNALNSSIGDLTKQSNAYKTTLNFLNDAYVSSTIAAREAADTIKESNKDAADAVIKYNGDMTKNDEDAKKAQADIQDKYNEALVKAADANAKAVEAAFSKLQDTAGKLTTDFGRTNEAANRKAQEDALTNQIHFQQDEAKAARNHANDLLKIKQDEQNKEQDLISSRNFSGLFQARRDVTDKITASNQQYQQEEQDRQTAFAQKNADDARQYLFEAGERKRKYEDANKDAEAQYRKDLTNAANALTAANRQAEKARNDSLRIEADKYRAQYDLLNKNIQAELQLYKQGQTNRLQVVANEQAALTQAAGLLAGTFRAALQFPSGNQINNNGGNTVNNAFNLSGAGVTVQQIASVVSQVIHGYLN